jgi:hypothetical protein
MTKNLSRRILLLSVLYIGIIFGIFALQFTSGNTFSVSLGLLRVSGAASTDASGKNVPVLPLHIAANGVDFFIDEQNPLMAYTDGKSGVPLKVTGIARSENPPSFTISFRDGVSVSFGSEKRGDSDIVSVSAAIPVKYQKIVFPYKITRSARVDKKDTLTLVSVGKRQYLFKGTQILPPSGSGAWALPIARATPVVFYQSYIPTKGLSIDELDSLPGASAASYSAAQEHFASKALESFKKSIDSGTLSEPLVAAYIAEMGRIGMYDAALDIIPESYRNGSSRTYLTNTFLNNLERTYAGLVIREKDERTDLSRKLTENNPACFEFPSLVPYLFDRDGTLLLKDVARVAGSLDVSTVSALQAAGILEAAGDFSAYLPSEQNSLSPLAESCERKLKASLVRIKDELYVSDDGKLINTVDSLRIARILVKYGTRADPAWAAAGRLLVTSLVSFAGDQSSLPASFAIEGEGDNVGIVAKSDRILDSATLYPLVLSGNTWYPRSLSLSLQSGASMWAWTSAQSVSATKPGADSLKITTRFPQGETHYMVIRGVRPFSRIQIYGMDFHPDGRFETYNSSGYRYNETTHTLYLKMRHKSEYEEVVLWFSPVAAKPSVEKSPAEADAAPTPSADSVAPEASAQ